MKFTTKRWSAPNHSARFFPEKHRTVMSQSRYGSQRMHDRLNAYAIALSRNRDFNSECIGNRSCIWEEDNRDKEKTQGKPILSNVLSVATN